MITWFGCLLFSYIQTVTFFFIKLLEFVSLLCVGRSSGRSLELDAAGISSYPHSRTYISVQ